MRVYDVRIEPEGLQVADEGQDGWLPPAFHWSLLLEADSLGAMTRQPEDYTSTRREVPEALLPPEERIELLVRHVVHRPSQTGSYETGDGELVVVTAEGIARLPVVLDLEY